MGHDKISNHFLHNVKIYCDSAFDSAQTVYLATSLIEFHKQKLSKINKDGSLLYDSDTNNVSERSEEWRNFFFSL